MEFLELKGTTRETTGKGAAKAIRREGNVPGILYSAKKEPLMVTVLAKDVQTCFKDSKTAQVFVHLTVDGAAEALPAMVKDYQIDPVSRQLVHVDLLEVAMDQKIVVRVPVTTVGKCAGVEFGGILQVIRRELEVICKPGDVPEKIELDITELEIGDAIHVHGIALEGDVEIPADVNFTVVTVLAPKGASEDDEDGDEESAEEVAVEEEA